MKNAWRSYGFTLLELILTIVLFGIVSLMAVSFFSKGVTRTDIPLTQLQADAQLQLVLENMIQAATGYTNDLPGFNTTLGSSGSSSTAYGYVNGTANRVSYYLADKRFVCPDANSSFATANANVNQFLLVTIKPSAASGISLTYIFSQTNNANACNNGS